MTFLVASAVGDFFLYLLLGLLALPVTAALANKIGKEKALLLWAIGILGFTIWMRPEVPAQRGLKAGSLADLPTESVELSVKPFDHPGINPDLARNLFRKHSDTRPLDPVDLQQPPWIPLAFPLPPTTPGPAPGFQRVLRGELLKAPAGDGSTIGEMPQATFASYVPTPEDVFDQVSSPGGRQYVYVRALRAKEGGWIREGEPGFDMLFDQLVGPEVPEGLRVEFALVGPTKTAQKYLDDDGMEVGVLRASQANVTSGAAQDGGRRWIRRKTVAYLYRDALPGHIRKGGLGAARNWQEVARAADKMADVGRTGKETMGGWRHAAELLERADELAIEAEVTAGTRADILTKLIDAYRALRQEDQVLRVLATYARTSPTDHNGWLWLGDLMLDLGLPHAAENYIDQALRRRSTLPEANLAKGDAATLQGDYGQALSAYGNAGSDAGRVSKARALLRLGRLSDAKTAAMSVLGSDPDNVEAKLVRGSVLYAEGNLASARADFDSISRAPAGDFLRAQASYNLGLTCLRLGQHDAALQAFEVCRSALEMGASPGQTPAEMVSPSLGLAIAAVARGEMDAVGEFLSAARTEAPLNPYVDFLAAVVAHGRNDVGATVRALERSQSLDRGYAELDSWLAMTYLNLAEQQVSTGADSETANETFRKALAYAERAAQREETADKDDVTMKLRLALVQLRSQHLSKRQRYEAAQATAQGVVDMPSARNNPVGHTLLGFCNYGIGGEERVSECLRNFQKVVQDVGDVENHPWQNYADYAASALRRVKKWRSLEEKSIEFSDTQLPRDWPVVEGFGVRVQVNPATAGLDFETRGSGGIKKEDGTQFKPSVQIVNSTLLTRASMEELSMQIKVAKEEGGRSVNNVTFGVQLYVGRGDSIRARTQGVGIFYDKGHLAFRSQGGDKDVFEDGLIHREGNDVEAREWPSSDWLELRVVRTDPDRGGVKIYLAPAGTSVDDMEPYLVFQDDNNGFKSSRSALNLWIGGWGNQAQSMKVQVRDIRVVRVSAGS